MSVEARIVPCLNPHANHYARPDEVENRHHEEEYIGEAPLVILAGLTGAVGKHVGGVVRGALAARSGKEG